MARTCSACRKAIGPDDHQDAYGRCQRCRREGRIPDEIAAADDDMTAEEQAIAAAAKAMMITTETVISDRKVVDRLGIVTAECAFGMNIFRDVFAGVRDVFGGRSKAVQATLRENREFALSELKKEAARLGANAVIGVDLDYSEMSGGNKTILFLVASGTAVKLEPIARD